MGLSAGQGIEVRFGIVVEWPCPGVGVWLFCIGMGMEFEGGDWGRKTPSSSSNMGLVSGTAGGEAKFVDF